MAQTAAHLVDHVFPHLPVRRNPRAVTPKTSHLRQRLMALQRGTVAGLRVPSMSLGGLEPEAACSLPKPPPRPWRTDQDGMKQW
jgi:hypothetical protein